MTQEKGRFVLGKLISCKKLPERNANEILDIFGIQPGAFTTNEAQYLVGIRTPDEISNRLATAKKRSIADYAQKAFAGRISTKMRATCDGKASFASDPTHEPAYA